MDSPVCEAHALRRFLKKILPLILSWLRVFRRAEASRRRPGVGQPRHTSAVRSEKCVRLRDSAWARIRVIAVFFCPRAPDLLTWRMSVFLHDFKRLERFLKLATNSRLITRQINFCGAQWATSTYRYHAGL
jgi:hypothetical protein